MRAGGSLAENVFALEFERVALALVLGVGGAYLAGGGVRVFRAGLFFGHLFFYGFAFPSSGHTLMLQGKGGYS